RHVERDRICEDLIVVTGRLMTQGLVNDAIPLLALGLALSTAAKAEDTLAAVGVAEDVAQQAIEAAQREPLAAGLQAPTGPSTGFRR
ncbi:MAG: hypothetical protein AAF658_10880, partial [Myxococcota bacterium]